MFGSGGFIYDGVLIEEHLLSFLKQIACLFQLRSDSLSVTQPLLAGEISVFVFVKMTLVSSITATLIFQRRDVSFCLTLSHSAFR